MVPYGKQPMEAHFDMATMMANLISNHPCKGEDSKDENEELQQIDTLTTTIGKVTYKGKI